MLNISQFWKLPINTRSQNRLSKQVKMMMDDRRDDKQSGRSRMPERESRLPARSRLPAFHRIIAADYKTVWWERQAAEWWAVACFARDRRQSAAWRADIRHSHDTRSYLSCFRGRVFLLNLGLAPGEERGLQPHSETEHKTKHRQIKNQSTKKEENKKHKI